MQASTAAHGAIGQGVGTGTVPLGSYALDVPSRGGEMRWFPIGVRGVHALIHLMGFFKAFGYADFSGSFAAMRRISRP